MLSAPLLYNVRTRIQHLTMDLPGVFLGLGQAVPGGRGSFEGRRRI